MPALVAFAAVAAQPAAAVTTITFSQFTQKAAGTPFVYTRNAGGSTLTVSDVDTIFTVLALGPLGNYDTKYSLSASTVGGVTDTGVQYEQPGWSGTMSFTSLDGTINYLTVTFSNAALNVLKPAQPGGSQSGSFIATGECGSDICYTSDVLNVDNLIVNDFALSFSSIVNYRTQRAITRRWSGSGTFAGAIPEPATWMMMIAGFGLVGAAVRRRQPRVAA
jgi:hypothetical protein